MVFSDLNHFNANVGFLLFRSKAFVYFARFYYPTFWASTQ